MGSPVVVKSLGADVCVVGVNKISHFEANVVNSLRWIRRNLKDCT